MPAGVDYGHGFGGAVCSGWESLGMSQREGQGKPEVQGLGWVSGEESTEERSLLPAEVQPLLRAGDPGRALEDAAVSEGREHG